jgi:hypothetical protein
MPTEPEMLAKDKYTVFDRKVKRYRKGIHSTYGRADCRIHKKLMWNRGAEVDESQPETKSSWFLDGRGECVESKCTLFCYHTLCNGCGASRTNNLYIKDTRPVLVIVRAGTPPFPQPQAVVRITEDHTKAEKSAFHRWNTVATGKLNPPILLGPETRRFTVLLTRSSEPTATMHQLMRTNKKTCSTIYKCNSHIWQTTL